MKVAVIIPARLESTRFPRKLLAHLDGKPVLQWVFESLKGISVIDNLIIATDSKELSDFGRSIGAEVALTSSSHLSGTDRCAEVAEQLEHDIIINVQGDEPFIEAKPIEDLIQLFRENKDIEIATLVRRFEDNEDIQDPNKVKVVTDVNHRALYFSRSVVPYGADHSEYKKHVGVYGFCRETLLDISKFSPTPLEKSERLEQLRWMDHGCQIYALETEYTSISIDTSEDLQAAEVHLRKCIKI